MVPRELNRDKREYPYRAHWLLKAAEAGHPIARFRIAEETYKKRRQIAQIEADAKTNRYRTSIYLHALLNSGTPDATGLSAPEVEVLQRTAKELLAEDAYTGKPLTDETYLALIEAAALAQGSGDLAWRLSNAYQGYNPRGERCSKGRSDQDHLFRFPEGRSGKGNVVGTHRGGERLPPGC